MTTAGAPGGLLRAAAGRAPDDVVAAVAEAAAAVGGREVALHLIDYEHVVLQPEAGGASASVVGTMTGRCFTAQEVLEAAGPGGVALWAPVTERAQRLGVLSLVVDRVDDDVRAQVRDLGALTALLITSASAYTDRFVLQRRHRPLDLAAEMQWALLPPLTCRSGGTTIAGLLEPAYEVGGDCFDYAVNGDVVSFAVFDAMGHGLPSSVLSGLAVGAYRHGRRTGVALPQALAAMDSAVAGLMGDTFVTALVAELDSRSGRLAWVSAGHPAPLVVRDGSVLAELPAQPALPLGLGLPGREGAGPPTELALQPGDRVLLYTDGVVEARSPADEEFGLDRLADLLVRECGSGLPAPEVLRRLVVDCVGFQGGRLFDDATLLLVEWDGAAGAS